MSFVALEEVSLRYPGQSGGTLALENASLAVAQGEFVAVVGPSGCGKSTLLKVVTGLWPASSGAVSVDGRAVAGPLKIVGMAFQNTVLLPWRTTLDNVMLPLEIVEPYRSQLRAKRREFEQRALHLLETVGLRGFGSSKPWQLSGGMQQRASLCRALIHQPSLLMLDEPFGALDAFTREELWLVLQDLFLETHPTVILVTHDLREAVFLADRVVVMSNRPGRITHERAITARRPRSLEDNFRPEFIDIAHDLRVHISTARQEKPADA